jgi:hypothetical protein
VVCKGCLEYCITYVLSKPLCYLSDMNVRVIREALLK